MDRRHRLTERLVDCRVPTIAAVNGVAAGAGMAIAIACDIRIAAASASFASAFAGVAFSGDYGGSWTLQRLIGPARAREFYFLGQVIRAHEAEAIGMVNHTVVDDELAASVRAMAHAIASGPPLALARMKQNMNFALRHDLASTLRVESEATVRLMRTRDNAEALAAFAAKRRPVFEGH